MNVTNDGQMFARGLKVLSEREDVRALRGEILHGGEHFVFLFVEAEHQAGFGRDIGMGLLGAMK